MDDVPNRGTSSADIPNRGTWFATWLTPLDTNFADGASTLISPILADFLDNFDDVRLTLIQFVCNDLHNFHLANLMTQFWLSFCWWFDLGNQLTHLDLQWGLNTGLQCSSYHLKDLKQKNFFFSTWKIWDKFLHHGRCNFLCCSILIDNLKD